MRRISFVIALSTLLFASIVSAQQALTTSVPNLIRYSGTLKDASPASTTVGVTFAIYKQQEGGAPIWMETQNVTPGRDGQYSVLLGSTTATGLPTICSRNRKNAGWECRCRDKPSSRVSCW